MEDTTIFEKRTYDLGVTIDGEETIHLTLRECEYRVLLICNYISNLLIFITDTAKHMTHFGIILYSSSREMCIHMARNWLSVPYGQWSISSFHY